MVDHSGIARGRGEMYILSVMSTVDVNLIRSLDSNKSSKMIAQTAIIFGGGEANKTV